ncbi:MAG: cytochrome c biogenesis protein CcdA [Pirellulales bacterium]
MISHNMRKLAILASLMAGLLFASAVDVQAQFSQLSPGGFGGQTGSTLLTASGVIVDAHDDQPPVLVVTGALDPDQWTYSITQQPGGPVQTKIKLDKSEKFSVGKFKPVDEPKVGPDPAFDNLMVEKHEGGATWYAPLKLADGVKVDQLEIKGKVFAQVCIESNCFPPKDHAFVAKVGKSPVKLPKIAAEDLPQAPAAAPNTAPSNTATQPPAVMPENSTKSPTEPSSTPPGLNNTGNRPSDTPPGIGDAPPGLSQVPPGVSEAPPGVANSTREATMQAVPSLDYDISQLQPKSQSGDSEATLPLMIGAALLAGFILNFMPCVLPVIGLKLLSFLEQGGSNPRRVLALNLWYSLGIISVFWVLAGISIALQLGLGQTIGLGQQKQLGWGQQFSYDPFNIALVSIVFVMALSFLGVWEIPIPGFAGSRNAQDLAKKEGALGAFAKGVITTVLATPCSGPFLGTAVGFALKSPPPITMTIFTFMGLGMSAPYILVGFRPSLMKFLPKPGAWMDTFKQVMGFVLVGTVLWLMLPIDAPLVMPTLILLAGLAAACWWIGRTPGYAELNDKLKAWGQASAFAAVVGWLAFATPQVTDPLPWQKFSMAQFVNDVNGGKTVMLEFTAEWCATCKTLKAANLDRTKTKATVKENNVVVYEVDIDHISEDEFNFFTKMQPSQGVPLVVIFPSGKKYEPISFGNGYTQSQILQALSDAGPSKSVKR